MSEDEAEELMAANPVDEEPCAPVVAMKRAQLLLACFPAGRPQDPEVYAMAVSAVLSEYPERVVMTVTDPRSGLTRTLKFLPAVSEVAAACDEDIARRLTLHNLAKHHLRIRNEGGYREKLEAMIGYRIGGDEPEENPEMAARLRALIQGAAA